MNAAILSIGDELLIGQVINTNAASISRRLNAVGVSVGKVVTVADDGAAIFQALKELHDSFDTVIVTGGLGPTHDDVTRTEVCRLFGTRLEPNEEVRQQVAAFLRKRNATWTPAADDQVLFPAGATIIPNPEGSAPGELFEHGKKLLIVMPGVPKEMEGMMSRTVLPLLAARAQGRVVIHRTLMTAGIPESALAAKIGDIPALLGTATLAFLPGTHGVRMRISIRGSDRAFCESEISRIEKSIRDKTGNFIFGTDEEELEAVVGKLLIESGKTVAVAESCTGGLILHRLTNISGSSSYLERGVVAYSNRSKTELLGVPLLLIEQHGAVSREVAEAMAFAIRDRAGTDIGISVTGIAGPTGGTPEKPVGLVWIGLADERGVRAIKSQFGGDRLDVKERASQAALNILRKYLLRIQD